MRRATYRLSRQIASFDFYNWLVMVAGDGAQEIVFDITEPKTSKFTRENVLQRFESIIQPGPALLGLPCRMGTARVGDIQASPSELRQWLASGRTFPRLASVRPPANGHDFTVTIRRNRDPHPRSPGRDSNGDVWRQFAGEIGATVIEDYFDVPIHLHDRMALYAGAKMNFGVCNGPVYMLSLSSYSMTMVVNGLEARNSVMKWHCRYGEKLSWMLPNQHLVWRDDTTIDNLRRIFDEVMH